MFFCLRFLLFLFRFLLTFFVEIFLSEIFSVRFDTSGSMIPLLVPEIEGGSPERDGGEGEGEGLVLEYSSSWIRWEAIVVAHLR